MLLDIEKLPGMRINVSTYINDNLKCDIAAIKDLWGHILRTRDTVRARKNLLMPEGLQKEEK